jgi:hypothetical protein
MVAIEPLAESAAPRARTGWRILYNHRMSLAWPPIEINAVNGRHTLLGRVDISPRNKNTSHGQGLLLFPNEQVDGSRKRDRSSTRRDVEIGPCADVETRTSVIYPSVPIEAK